VTAVQRGRPPRRLEAELEARFGLEGFGTYLWESGMGYHTARMYTDVARQLIERTNGRITPTNVGKFLAMGTATDSRFPSESTYRLRLAALKRLAYYLDENRVAHGLWDAKEIADSEFKRPTKRRL
jgi:hypothetical protein